MREFRRPLPLRARRFLLPPFVVDPVPQVQRSAAAAGSLRGGRDTRRGFLPGRWASRVARPRPAGGPLALRLPLVCVCRRCHGRRKSSVSRPLPSSDFFCRRVTLQICLTPVPSVFSGRSLELIGFEFTVMCQVRVLCKVPVSWFSP